MNDQSSRLLTLPELADATRLPLRFLREEARAGRIPALDTGHRLRFNLRAVESVLLDRAGKGTAGNAR